MQALKAAVIGMGVLLVIGIIGLVYAIVTDAGKRDGAPAPVADGPAVPQAAPPMGEAPVRVDLPPGSEVVAVHPDGARLYLHLKTGAGARILVLDSATGAVIGRIDARADMDARNGSDAPTEEGS